MDADSDFYLGILALTVGGILLTYWFINGGSNDLGIDDNSDLGYSINSAGDNIVTLTSTQEGRLHQLEPETQSLVRQLIGQLQAQGIQLQVGQTLRTVAEEKADVAAGKSSATQVYSWHNIGRAVDLYPIDPGTGNPDWNGKRDDLYQALANAAVALGFRSLAYNADGSRHYLNTVKGKVWDGGHIEYRGGYASLSDAISAEGPAYGIA